MTILWNEHALNTRERIIKYFTQSLFADLTQINPAFRMFRVEARNLIEAAEDILKGKQGPKHRLPLIVWQHGKVNETYCLECLLVYSKGTVAAYGNTTAQVCKRIFSKECGPFLGQMYTIRETEHPIGLCIEIVVNMDQVVRFAITHEAGG